MAALVRYGDDTQRRYIFLDKITSVSAQRGPSGWQVQISFVHGQQDVNLTGAEAEDFVRLLDGSLLKRDEFGG
jgi:hypothetical protein